MVARELSKLLNIKSEDVTSFVTGEVGLDMDVVSSLVTSLLSGCVKESRTSVGQRLKLVCADCLGALGAVDPGASKEGETSEDGIVGHNDLGKESCQDDGAPKPFDSVKLGALEERILFKKGVSPVRLEDTSTKKHGGIKQRVKRSRSALSQFLPRRGHGRR
ncbi:non-specific serine,threonine protein kinase [Sarracenia purpurea var. burkii]